MSMPDNEQYRIIFTFRRALRLFLRWSEQQAAKEGLTAQQHQLLLSVRAHPSVGCPNIGDLASHLAIRAHSAVGLVNRSEAMGLIARRPDSVDQRVVRVCLTPQGEAVLDRLTTAHLLELSRVAAMLQISEEFLANLSEQFLIPAPPANATHGQAGGQLT